MSKETESMMARLLELGYTKYTLVGTPGNVTCCLYKSGEPVSSIQYNSLYPFSTLELAMAGAVGLAAESAGLPPHDCGGYFPYSDKGFGDAMYFCCEDEQGRFWAGTLEYRGQVNFCPYCGEKAPVQAETKSLSPRDKMEPKII